MMRNTHSAYTNLLRDFGRVVDINLVEFDIGELLGKLLEDGRDDAARATPCSPEVKDCYSALVDLRFVGMRSVRSLRMRGHERTAAWKSSMDLMAVTVMVKTRVKSKGIRAGL